MRALQRAQKANNHDVDHQSTFKKGDRMWVFYKYSQQNIPVGWVEARVIEAEEHTHKCRRSKKGTPMSFSYDHVRWAPEFELMNELTRFSLEDECYGR